MRRVHRREPRPNATHHRRKLPICPTSHIAVRPSQSQNNTANPHTHCPAPTHPIPRISNVSPICAWSRRTFGALRPKMADLRFVGHAKIRLIGACIVNPCCYPWNNSIPVFAVYLLSIYCLLIVGIWCIYCLFVVCLPFWVLEFLSFCRRFFPAPPEKGRL